MTMNGVVAVFCVILPNSVALEANFVNVIVDRPALSATKM